MRRLSRPYILKVNLCVRQKPMWHYLTDEPLKEAWILDNGVIPEMVGLGKELWDVSRLIV